MDQHYDEQLYGPWWSCSPGRTHDGWAQLPLSSHQRKFKTRDSQKIKEEVLFILVFFLKERGIHGTMRWKLGFQVNFSRKSPYGELRGSSRAGVWKDSSNYRGKQRWERGEWALGMSANLLGVAGCEGQQDSWGWAKYHPHPITVGLWFELLKLELLHLCNG